MAWYSISFLTRLLTSYSSQYVTKLVFSPLRFVKWKDPYSYQRLVRDRLEEDTFSHNLFSLSFGKYVTAYEGYIKAQDYLSKKSQDIKILLRALRHLPRLTDVTVVFRNEIIGAREIMSAFGVLNGNELTLDSEYTLPVLIEALSGSERKLNTFKIIPDQDPPPLELYDMSRREFNHNHEPRFRYITEGPAIITTRALWNAFCGDHGSMRKKAIKLMSGLRELDVSGVDIDANNPSGLLQLNFALQPLVAFSDRLERLRLRPSNVGISNARLDLSYILQPNSLCQLQYLELDHVDFPERLLTELLTKSSRSLVLVVLSDPHILGTDGWSDFLRQLRNANWEVLHHFALYDCDGTENVAFAQDYLKRITDKDPIVQANEANQD